MWVGKEAGRRRKKTETSFQIQWFGSVSGVRLTFPGGSICFFVSLSVGGPHDSRFSYPSISAVIPVRFGPCAVSGIFLFCGFV